MSLSNRIVAANVLIACSSFQLLHDECVAFDFEKSTFEDTQESSAYSATFV